MRLVLFPIYIILIVVICSCTKKTVQYMPQNDSVLQERLQKENDLKSLYSHYRSWQGTPYRNGGSSRRGVDCSGFVHLTYQKLFNVTLPRTTREQRLFGYTVERNQLKPGDLLFFKTGWFSHHVGIYLENYAFMHASTKQGVVISSLQDEYWRNNFYLARRISLL